MNLNLKNLSLHKQTVAVFVGFVVLATINFFVLSHLRSKLDAEAIEIEAAKALELLPRQLAVESQLYVNGNTAAKSQISDISDDFDATLEHFYEETEVEDNEDSLLVSKRQGLYGRILGEWTGTKEAVNNLLLEPATIDTVVMETRQVPLYDSLNTVTTETSQKVLSISNPRVARANNSIQQTSAELSKLGRIVLARQVKTYENKSRLLTYASLSFLLVVIAGVVALLMLIKKRIFAPVRELSQVAAHVSNGDLSKKVSYAQDNEIGHIARSINKITENLRNATAFVNAIENGKLEEEFKGLDEQKVAGRGLEAALLTMRDQMKKVDEEERERKWATEGLARFVEILRSTSDNVHALGDVIISNLVNYTKSNQGGIFILNEDENTDTRYLELISLYAFDAKKYDQRRYRPGEGLVGQTYLEKKTIYLLEVPQKYISITSGLGGANPKAILLVPLKINEDIYGVVELASFNEYKNYEIEFVEKLAESIASTIAGVKNNQRTKLLLEESQALTEQMQAQEEEMRQNMEELSATQEEMSRKEVEMTAQLTAINNSVASAEFDMSGLLITANDNYVKALGYQQVDEIREKPFAVLSAGDNSALWRELKSGVSQSGDYKKLKKTGEELQVRATYTPVKNDSGDYYKVIELVLSMGAAQNAVSEVEWENMKEVEEELRQNLEELEITQEQLDRKLQLSEATLAALEDVVKIITITSGGQIMNITHSAVVQLGMDAAEVKQRTITDIVEQDVITDAVEGPASGKDITLKGKETDIKVKVEVRYDEKRDLIHLIWM